ncbi:hypothetical protein B0H12DRAFT_149524 [Mycena haematopus]|nr:hypothetical protein B0H12DRAFT_149524 [Mycena haematopus]
MMSSSYADFQRTSNIVHSFIFPNTPALENLFRYHKHQTQLLSAIFSNIEKHMSALVESSSVHRFVSDVTLANRRIQRLERSLRGGSLAVWFQFKESQQELADIQRSLALHETSKKAEFKKRLDNAQMKDSERMRKQIQEIVEKFQPRKNLFRISPPIPPLEELFPALKDPDLPKNDEAYRVDTLHSILKEFEKMSPPSHLSTLMKELDLYVNSKVDSLKVVPGSHANIQVIRKPSRVIVAVLIGSKTCDAIRKHYYPDPKVNNAKLPILYTATKTVGEITGEFLVAHQAISSRPDSRKFIQWEHGAAPSTDIYLVEKPAGDVPFILATLLGSTVESDVLKTLPRADRLIKDVICPPTEHPWIAEDGWVAYNMHELQSDSNQFKNYSHQIFVKGPPAHIGEGAVPSL